jgi:hypothetical protein
MPRHPSNILQSHSAQQRVDGRVAGVADLLGEVVHVHEEAPQGHMRTVPSQLPVASSDESGLNPTHTTRSAWPVRTASTRPSRMSKIRAVWSSEPTAANCPSDETATSRTPAAGDRQSDLLAESRARRRTRWR